MKTELISFYCDVGDCTYYSDHAFRIKEECFRLKLSHDFRKVRSENDYRLNCLRKPKYILSMLEEKKKIIGQDQFIKHVRSLFLQTIDMVWVEHLESMD